MKLLTVAVPCYNSADYMEKCINSLLAGGERVEIIVIDDGSTDATGRIADRYAEEYPSIIKVVHQENQGHGEGINQGLRLATGEYFRVVDSDDWLSDNFPAMLDELESLAARGGVDLYVTNYVLTHDDSTLDSVVNYRWEFRGGSATRWEQTRRFKANTYLTLHSVAYRTRLLRDCGIVLPKHTFYEDNLLICSALNRVERMHYSDLNLYHYKIGREGQSVQTDIFAKRYAQQMKVSMSVFCLYDLADETARNKKRGIYLRHECLMLLILATAAARLNGSREAEDTVREMWREVVQRDKRFGFRFRYLSPVILQMLPGAFGRAIANAVFSVSRRLLKN